jgi:hypothetical protein
MANRKRQDTLVERDLKNQGLQQFETMLGDEEANFVAAYPPAAAKKVLGKIDIRLLPVITALYVLSYLDRSNIANAQIEVRTLLSFMFWTISLNSGYL